MRSAELRKATAALLPLYGITLIDVFGYMVMIPLLPYLARKFGASGAVVGGLLAVMAAASMLAAPLWGALSDKWGRKPIVLISQVISLCGYLLLAWAPSLWMLFVARTIAGIGGGSLGVTQSYIADVTNERQRDKAYAAFGVVFGLGIVLGPVCGGVLVGHGFALPFLLSAAIEAVNIGLTLRFLPRTGKRSGTSLRLGAAARIVWQTASVRSLVVRHFLFIFAVTYFFSIFALFVGRVLHFGPQHASWLIAVAGIAGTVAMVLVVGPFAKRFGDAAVAQAGLLLSVPAYAFLGGLHAVWGFLALLVLWAIGSACIEPTLTSLLSESMPADKRGATLGFNDAMSNVALVLAPGFGGWMIDRNVGAVGLAPAAACALAFALGIWRRREDAGLPSAHGEQPSRSASTA